MRISYNAVIVAFTWVRQKIIPVLPKKSQRTKIRLSSFGGSSHNAIKVVPKRLSIDVPSNVRRISNLPTVTEIGTDEVT